MNKEQNTCNNSTNFYKKNSIQKNLSLKKRLNLTQTIWRPSAKSDVTYINYSATLPCDQYLTKFEKKNKIKEYKETHSKVHNYYIK